jgi:hypothetical protein
MGIMEQGLPPPDFSSVEVTWIPVFQWLGRRKAEGRLMDLLDNPKHERFAQELAKGKSATEAYKEAGYSGSSDTLRKNAPA